MIPALVIALVAIAALVFALAPLLRGPRLDDTTFRSEQQEAEAKKHAAFSALIDLEADHEIGKLSPPDFELLRSEYEREALSALRELDALGAASNDDLEAEITAMKARLVCANCGELRIPGEPCPNCETIS